MNDRESKARVTGILETLGYAVTPVRRGPKETPDLRAKRYGESLLVEIKSKRDDGNEMARREEEFDKGDVHCYSLPLGKWDLISRILEKASRQLQNEASKNDFCLVWFEPEGIHEREHHQRCFSSIYGLKYICDKSGSIKPCYYFDDSDFYKHRNILSGVVVTTGSEIQLCVNDHHARADVFRRSSLYSFFSKCSGVHDPLVIEARGEAYIVDSAVEQKDEAGVRTFLKTKYGLIDPMPIMPTSHGVEVFVEDLITNW